MKNTILLSSVGGGNTHTHTHTIKNMSGSHYRFQRKKEMLIFIKNKISCIFLETMIYFHYEKKTFIMLQTIPQIILKKEVKLSCFNDNNQKCNLSTKSAY